MSCLDVSKPANPEKFQKVQNRDGAGLYPVQHAYMSRALPRLCEISQLDRYTMVVVAPKKNEKSKKWGGRDVGKKTPHLLLAPVRTVREEHGTEPGKQG